MSNPDEMARMRDVESPYGDGQASKNIVDIIEKLHAEGDLLGFEKEITTKNV